MKISEEVISSFERDQKNYGTEAAIYNLVFTIACDILTEYGAQRIQVIASKDESQRNHES